MARPKTDIPKVRKYVGNDPAGYKREAPPPEGESAQVKMWRGRIKRAWNLLQLSERIKKANANDAYLDGTKQAKNGKRIYYRYLLPLLEELHRQTLPSVPQPRIEARDAAAEPMEDACRELLAMDFAAGGVKETIEQLQWDDDRLGVGFAKTVHRTESQPAELSPLTSADAITPHMTKAEAENAAPMTAQVAREDADYVHVSVHDEALPLLPPDSQEYMALSAHQAEHTARLERVRGESVRLERVSPDQFVYDTDVPWHRRTWEAELRSTPIREMLGARYRNINPLNLPPENKEDGADIPYEDLTGRAWHIHDRLNEKWLVVSADGPEDGLFLSQEEWPYPKIDIYRPLVFRPWRATEVQGVATIEAAVPILDRLAEVDFYIDRHVITHASYQMWTARGSMSAKDKSAVNNPEQAHVELSPEALMSAKEKKPPEIPGTLIDQREILKRELRALVGADAQDVGESNPHRITAQESGVREIRTDARKSGRQEIVADMLSWVGLNFLALRKSLGTLAINVRGQGEEGVKYQEIDPANIPDNVAVSFDVRGETDEARGQRTQAWTAYMAFLQTGIWPVDWSKVGPSYGRALGITRPEQFRAPAPQPGIVPGQTPGMPGIAQPPQPGQSPQLRILPQEQQPQPQPAGQQPPIQQTA